jgi:hypothetical protein
MAEVARQVGRAAHGARPAPYRRLRYKRELDLMWADAGSEAVSFDDLLTY